ncbi:hypothetical protein TRVL_06499 [Trypanosoma vivax]|nr:hypothetical protein TRVL_06499 [Trypanosoma vivax]
MNGAEYNGKHGGLAVPRGRSTRAEQWKILQRAAPLKHLFNRGLKNTPRKLGTGDGRNRSCMSRRARKAEGTHSCYRRRKPRGQPMGKPEKPKTWLIFCGSVRVVRQLCKTNGTNNV